MTRPRKFTGGILVLISLVFLGACNLSPQSEVASTQDINLLFTAAANTVMAQLTQTEVAKPTSTWTPSPIPTNTEELPTLPPLPGANTLDTPTLSLTLAPLPGLATATVALGPRADKAEWVSNSPPDGASVVTNAKFDIRWTIKNVGTTTWTTDYTFRYFAQDRLTEKDVYHFRGTVKPGESTVLIADAVAPSKPGTYNTWWKLVNAAGTNFGDLSLEIKVVRPGPTATTNPTQNAIKVCCDDNPDNDGTICDDFDYSVCPSK